MKEFNGNLDGVLMDDAGRRIMGNIAKIAFSVRRNKLELLPHLHLISNKGRGVTKLGKCYADILDASDAFFPYFCDYLELNFPHGAKETDYQKFFQSAREKAVFQNYFTGVFLISLEEWRGVHLKKDDVFGSLINFVNKNKRNIRFIFLTPEDDEFCEEVGRVLRKEIEISTIRLSALNEIQSWEYLSKILRERDLSFTKEGVAAAKKLVKQALPVIKDKGYHALNELGNRIEFEYLTCGNNVNISAEIVASVSDLYAVKEGEQPVIKIGFSL